MPPMLSFLHDFLLIFIPLFVVIDPAGTIPVYLALTDRYQDSQRRRLLGATRDVIKRRQFNSLIWSPLAR